MTYRIKVLLVEDHTIVREGLRVLLTSRRDTLHICGEAKDGGEAVRLAKQLNPDIVLMDMSLPVLNGIEATRLIKKSLPKTKIIALTMYINEEFVLQMIKAGASGYLVKNLDSIDLLNAIETIMENDFFYCPSFSEEVMQAYIEKARSQEVKELTRREREILSLIAKGDTSKQIAAKLFISVKTVRNHRGNIMQKLNIHNVVSLIRYAAQRNLIDIFSPISSREQLPNPKVNGTTTL